MAQSDVAAENVRSCTGCGICCEYPRNEMKASPLEALAAAVRLRDDPRLLPRLGEITARVEEAVRRYSLREVEDDGRPYTCPLLEPDKTCLVHGRSQPLGCIVFAPVSADRCDMRMEDLEAAGIAHAEICDQLLGEDEWPVHAFPVALRHALRLLESRAAASKTAQT